MEDDKYIPSIFNYCDRWCERCPMTDRCRSYAMSAEWEAKNPDKVGDWAAQLSDSFKQTMSILQKWAAEEGINLDELPEYIPPAPSAELVARREYTVDLIKSYENLVDKWKTENKEQIEEWAKRIHEQHEIGMKTAEKEFSVVENAYEIISWYFYFIRAKIKRAYSSLEDDFDIEEDPIQNDMNGSVKIGIIAIERSLAAWEMMREHIEGKNDGIIDIMVALARARKRILNEFPTAMQFIRPGFDE